MALGSGTASAGALVASARYRLECFAMGRKLIQFADCTVEEEAFWERVTRIAAGKAPFFEYYRNTGRDFSQLDLSNSLEAWIATRRRILEFVQTLPETRLELTGTHATFGPITVLDVLQIMLNHDREHLVELQQMVVTLSFKDHLAR
jgi:hypothetical protein